MNTTILEQFDLKHLNAKQLHERLTSQVCKVIADPTQRDLIEQAYQLAADLHKHDTRSPGPYIEHPLRCACRMITYLGVTDAELIISMLLHDTVEDHPEELCIALGYTIDPDKPIVNQALEAIRSKFGDRVARILAGMTNPEVPKQMPKVEKNVIYVAHVTEEIKDVDVFILKFSDFNDNALGLHHTQNANMIISLAKKYAPLYRVFREQAFAHHQNGLISQGLLDVILERLTTGEKQNNGFLAIA